MNLLLKVKTYEEYEDATKYGELFYIAMISDFKEDLPPAVRKYRFSDRHPHINEADIIIFGDSHFDHSRSLSYPELLANTTGQKVYYYRINRPYWGNALAYLETNEYKPRDPKLFIYGTTERYIYERFIFKYEPKVIQVETKPHQYLLNNVLFLENTDLLYSTIFKRSYLTYDLNVILSTLRFKLFNYISSFTPAYHIDHQNGSWLFVKEGIEHFNRQFSDDEIATIASNIKHMATVMKQRYNLDFLFFPVPERTSIYFDELGNGEYNLFLLRLYDELDKLQVAYIPLYKDYKQSQNYVYHKTDTHWNQKGVTMGLEKTLKKINGWDIHEMATASYRK